MASIHPCAGGSRPCTGPGDCSVCGAGWSCQAGRCAPGGAGAAQQRQDFLRARQQAQQGLTPPQQAPGPTVQQVAPNRPAVAAQQAPNPGVNPLRCTQDSDCAIGGRLNFNCNNRNLDEYCNTATGSCSCRSRRRSTTPCQGGQGPENCPDCTTAPNTEKYCNGTTCGCRTPRSTTTTPTRDGDPCPSNGDCSTISCANAQATKQCIGNVCKCVAPETVQPNCQNDRDCSCTGGDAGKTPRCDEGECICVERTAPSCTDPANDCPTLTCPPAGNAALTEKKCVGGRCACGRPAVVPGTTKNEGDSCTARDTCTCSGAKSTWTAACDSTTNRCTCTDPGTGGTDRCRDGSDTTNCPACGTGQAIVCDGNACGCEPSTDPKRPGDSCSQQSDCADIDCSGTGPNSTGVCNSDNVCVCTEDAEPPEVVNPQRTISCTDDGQCQRSATLLGCTGRQQPKCLGTEGAKTCQCQERPNPTVTEGSACGGTTGNDCSAVTCTGAKRPVCRPSDNTCRCVDVGGACTEGETCPEGTVCIQGRCQVSQSQALGRPGFPEIAAPPVPQVPTLTPFAGTGQIGGQVELPSTAIQTETPLDSPEINIDLPQLRQTPGFQFRLREGMKAVAAQMNAAGMLASGDAMRAFNKYAQEFASQEYEKEYQRKVDQYNRKSEKEKDEYRRKADQFNRDMTSVLTRYRFSAEDFQRALAAHGAQRADVLAQFGMTQQQFNAMLESIRTTLDISEAEWGRWLSVWTVEQGNLRGLLGLA